MLYYPYLHLALAAHVLAGMLDLTPSSFASSRQYEHLREVGSPFVKNLSSNAFVSPPRLEIW